MTVQEKIKDLMQNLVGCTKIIEDYLVEMHNWTKRETIKQCLTILVYKGKITSAQEEEELRQLMEKLIMRN